MRKYFSWEVVQNMALQQRGQGRAANHEGSLSCGTNPKGDCVSLGKGAREAEASGWSAFPPLGLTEPDPRDTAREAACWWEGLTHTGSSGSRWGS